MSGNLCRCGDLSAHPRGDQTRRGREMRRWGPEPWRASERSPAARFLVGAVASQAARPSATTPTASPTRTRCEKELAEGEATFNPYVKIAPDNTITVIAPRAEMGQGVSTSLAALVAEELNVRPRPDQGRARANRLGLLQLGDARRGRSLRLLQREHGGGDRARPDGRRSARCWAPGHRRVVVDARRVRQDARGGRHGARDADRGGSCTARRSGRRTCGRGWHDRAPSIGQVGDLWRGGGGGREARRAFKRAG